MRRLLSSPHFASLTDTDRARMLHTVVWGSMVIATLALGTVAAVQPAVALRAVIAITVIDLLGMAALVISRAGETRFASILFVAGLILLPAGMAITAGGIHSPGVNAYLVFVLMAGLLLGERSGVVVGIICSLVGLGLVIAEGVGALPAPLVSYTPFALWVLATLYIMMAISLQRLAAGAVRRALQRAEGDLGERVKAEQRLRLALDAGEIGVWDQDMSTGRLTGDERLFALYGIPLTTDRTIDLDTWLSRVHPEDRGKVTTALADLAGVEHVWVDYRAVRPDGSQRHVEAAASAVRDEAGRLARIVGVNIDVTDRREVERERERLVHDLGERVKELGLLHATMKLLQRNRPLDRALLNELVRLVPPAWQYPELCQARIAYGDIQASTPGWCATPWMLTSSFSTGTGSGRVEVAYTAERPFLGEERALLSSLVDLLVSHVDRVQSEDQRRGLEGQLRQSQKMQALGTLAGGIAHDFNNILTAINGNAELGLADAPNDHPLRESLSEIAKAGVRAKDLVRRILIFSRKQESRLKVTSLAPVADEALQLLRASLPKTIEIRTRVEPGLPLVSADATQIHQIVMNLGTNAGHAMRERGGTLSVELDRIMVDGPDTSPSADLKPGPHVRLTVGDTGTGMSKEILERIFEPFFTTKGLDGTGLGLSVVHGILREHEGAITVESELGKGTAFRLFFPVAAAGAAAAESATPEVVRGQGQHIMYVDDEEALVFVMTRILQRIGYRSTGYSNPHEALQAFRTHPREFDAVITDLSMPGMTGLELAKAMLEIRPDLGVALSSGTRDEVEAAKRAGVKVLIHKPVSIDELSSALAGMLSSARVTA